MFLLTGKPKGCLAQMRPDKRPKMSFPLPRVVPGEEDNPLLLPYSPSDLNLHLDFHLGSEFQTD